MKTKFTLVNEAGMTLKYVFKDRMVFNGDNPNERRQFTYLVAKRSTANQLLDVALGYGFENIEISEVSNNIEITSEIEVTETETPEEVIEETLEVEVMETEEAMEA